MDILEVKVSQTYDINFKDYLRTIIGFANSKVLFLDNSLHKITERYLAEMVSCNCSGVKDVQISDDQIDALVTYAKLYLSKDVLDKINAKEQKLKKEKR